LNKIEALLSNVIEQCPASARGLLHMAGEHRVLSRSALVQDRIRFRNASVLLQGI